MSLDKIFSCNDVAFAPCLDFSTLSICNEPTPPPLILRQNLSCRRDSIFPPSRQKIRLFSVLAVLFPVLLIFAKSASFLFEAGYGGSKSDFGRLVFVHAVPGSLPMPRFASHRVLGRFIPSFVRMLYSLRTRSSLYDCSSTPEGSSLPLRPLPPKGCDGAFRVPIRTRPFSLRTRPKLLGTRPTKYPLVINW